MIPKASKFAASLGVKVRLNSPRKEDPLRKDLELLAPRPRALPKAGDKQRPLSYLRVHTNGKPRLVPEHV